MMCETCGQELPNIDMPSLLLMHIRKNLDESKRCLDSWTDERRRKSPDYAIKRVTRLTELVNKWQAWHDWVQQQIEGQK